ncbi:hypothetical protein Gogos_000996 [Gossypium gossypioides]|uniref:Uncharacterized protein n=1 Tax=Gossypium gossypioides TaxID=34282 RepID=A0A7J9CUT8_GOSGO|nr:hypothetical protein [Gossypium gossypioides]
MGLLGEILHLMRDSVIQINIISRMRIFLIIRQP